MWKPFEISLAAASARTVKTGERTTAGLSMEPRKLEPRLVLAASAWSRAVDASGKRIARPAFRVPNTQSQIPPMAAKVKLQLLWPSWCQSWWCGICANGSQRCAVCARLVAPHTPACFSSDSMMRSKREIQKLWKSSGMRICAATSPTSALAKLSSQWS
eukprot:scaffold12446_cov27-Tisochrysis_lutea.AAC.1